MTETEAPPLKKDVVPSQYRDRYKETGGTCGDLIGSELQRIGKDGLPALHAVMKENGIPEKKWATHNPGMQRMNLANVLRSRLLNGEDVYLLGKQHNIHHMREDYNGKIDKDNPTSVARFAEAYGLQNNERSVKALIRTFFPAAKKAATSKEERDAIAAQKQADKELAKRQRDKATADKKAAAEADKQRKAAEKATAKAAKDADKASKAKKQKETEPA